MKIRLKVLIIILLIICVIGVSAILVVRELSKNALESEIRDRLVTTAQSRADHVETFISNQKTSIDLVAMQINYYTTYFEEYGDLPKEAMSYVFNAESNGLAEDSQLIIMNESGKLNLCIGKYGFQVGIDFISKLNLGTWEKIQGLGEGPNEGMAELVNQMGMPEITRMDLSDWEVFHDAIDKTCVMDTRQEEFTPDTVLAMAAPYHMTEELAGVVVILGEEKELARITADPTGLGETGEVYILNDEGHMITPSRFIENDALDLKVDLEGKVVNPEESMEVVSSENYLGTNVLGVYRQLPGTGWTIVAEISTSEAYAPVSALTRTMLYVIGGILVLGVLLSFLMSRMLTSPILKLQKGAETVMQGNLDYRIGLKRSDELGELSVAFDKMTASLKQSREELEEHAAKLEVRVLERTAQLEGEVAARRQGEDKLREVMAELQRSNEELEQFAYVASHDLHEPLRMVTSYMQLLARRYKGILDNEADDFINYAVDGAARMQAMINALLDYSRVGTRGKQFEPVDSETVFENALYNLEILIEENGAVVTHDPLPPVVADKTQMGQLLQNLIGNAIKFHGEEPPRIHVSAVRQGEEWVFSVSDNGIGIESQYANHIFEIFQRLHTRAQYPGTGIGLSVCRKIVERHGGRIWMESEPGKGTTFYFTIPIRVREEAPV